MRFRGFCPFRPPQFISCLHLCDLYTELQTHSLMLPFYSWVCGSAYKNFSVLNVFSSHIAFPRNLMNSAPL